MHVTKEHAERHSEKDFISQFYMLVDAGAGVIQVRTTETVRALAAIRRTLAPAAERYREWDVVNGMRTFDESNLNDETMVGDGNVIFSMAFKEPMGHIHADTGTDKLTYYVFVSPQFNDDVQAAHMLALYNEFLPATDARIVLLTGDTALPEIIGADSVQVCYFSTPGLSELRKQVKYLIGMHNREQDEVALSDDDIDKLCFAGAGMSALQFDTYISLALVKASASETKVTIDSLLEEVRLGKTDIVNSNDILELYPTANIEDVGGMDALKEWISKRADCYSDEAVAFGVEPPKGMVLVGVPGSGKSLVGKAVANVLGVPLVRLDFGKVFSSYVGSSEQRIRTALRMVEAMSPVCLLVDEIDKGLGGIGGSGDSGISMRVLGSFLTWLQDCKYPVFTMVTANNVSGLPPELLRRGRFDGIFSTDLPTPDERRDVLRIHLRKRGYNIDDFDNVDIDKVIGAADGYVPAEIEAAVKDGLIDAFSDRVDFSMSHVEKALKSMVPLSKSFAEQIARMREWAQNNATPVTGKKSAKAKNPVGELVRRSRITKREVH